MIELACEDVIFHFNKKHLEDATVPMWILKTKGKSFYVQHVDCRQGWNTKETPGNNHTKGSIKIRNAHLTIDDDNCATIAPLEEHVKSRLRNQERGITRVIMHEGFAQRMRDALQQMSIRHGPIRAIGGACSSTFYITDIYDRSEFTALLLALADTPFRELMPNEGYYRVYDDPKYRGRDFIDEEEIEEEDDEHVASPTLSEKPTTSPRGFWRQAWSFLCGKRRLPV